jgi:starch synthase
MKISVLFVTWELAPFFHVGGLGDVSRSLPRALFDLGVDIRVAMPFYKILKLRNVKRKKIGKILVKYDGEESVVEIWEIRFLEKPIPVYLFKNTRYLDEPGADMYPFFNISVEKFSENNFLDWKPQIIHCNDWHTGLIPLLIKHFNPVIKTVFTIHNLLHQGRSTIEILNRTGMDSSKCRVIQWEIKKGQINSLLEGIVHSDLVNTVSPTYAKEILTEEFGVGLDDILRDEQNKISGILNGIDYAIRNPFIDSYIKFKYSAMPQNTDGEKGFLGFIEGKEKNKAFLQEKLKFEVDEKIPLIGFVGRFSSGQKGVELIHKMMRRLDLEKFQFVFLGKGEEEWEERYLWFAKFFPKNVRCEFEFDEKLASQIYAGSDFLLIPSKFEPCGLIQMIAMKYGTLPIARAVGGLKDSIDDNENGFLFKKYASHDLEAVLRKAILVWKSDKKKMYRMIQNAMEKDFSWDLSAKKYIDLYNRLLG